MFCKTNLLTLALAFVTSTSLVLGDPIRVKHSTPISLSKRQSLTNPDGTFNVDKAVREVVKQKKFVFPLSHRFARSLTSVLP